MRRAEAAYRVFCMLQSLTKLTRRDLYSLQRIRPVGGHEMLRGAIQLEDALPRAACKFQARQETP